MMKLGLCKPGQATLDQWWNYVDVSWSCAYVSYEDKYAYVYFYLLGEFFWCQDFYIDSENLMSLVIWLFLPGI